MPVQKLNYIAEQIEQGNQNITFPRFKDKTMIKIASIIYRIYNSMNEKQKQVEHEQEKLNHIFGILHQGIILLDTGNNLKHWNQISEEYLNSKFIFGENIIKNISDIDSLVFIKDILKIEKNKIIRKKLKNRTFEIDIHIMQKEKLFVFYDITERFEYENFKTELIGNITHELKTPLAMIMGYAETLLENNNLTEEQLNKFIKTIYKSSNNLNNLINDILELHKLESEGKNFTVKEAIYIKDIVDELKQQYSDTTKQLHINSKDNKIYIIYDHLMSILTNLIDNALKYSQGKNIYLNISKNNDELQIIIDDEGPKIPMSEKNRIFERFYTIHKSKHRSETGTGLGLSIVKHIVSLYEGKINLTYNEFGGNKFEITLKDKNNK
jgi:two-component system phosphate regulon sensor histidine kinase PhoR